MDCNVATRGVIDGRGGCMSMGGICIGCTMPEFPDRFPRLDEGGVDRADPHRVVRVPGNFLHRSRASGTAAGKSAGRASWGSGGAGGPCR